MESDWQHSCTTIQAATAYLLKSKKFTDVTFVVGDEKEVIEAHKLILMARSPVFEAMFERWETGTGKNCEIEVPEISGKSFQLFLKFLYENEFAVTGNEAAEVLYLAHKYDTKELASKCSHLLKSAMDIKNVIHILQVATKLQQKSLQAQAMKFIFRNGKQVLEDIGFLQIDLNTLSSVLQNDKLEADELTVFRAAVRWAEDKCDVQKIKRTVVNKRNLLKDVIHLIRFPTMTSQEFTDEVVAKQKGILTDSETIGIYMHFNTGSPVQSGVPKLPFSKTKRLSAIIYTVIPYWSPGQFHACCRHYQQQGSNVICQTPLQFTTRRNICVTAIELYDQPAGIPQFSISVYPSNQPSAFTLAELRPNSSTVFELTDGGIDVPIDVPYVVKVECDGGQGPFRSNRQTYYLSSSMQANCGKESITFSFSAGSGTCTYGRYGLECICSGQIKSIHFKAGFPC